MNNIYSALIELIEKGKHNEAIVLNYLMLKSIKGGNKIINKKTGAEIGQHQYQISRRELSIRTCLSEQQIRTVIANLKQRELIGFEVVSGIYVFTINPDKSLNDNILQGLPTQQVEKSTQQVKKINPENNPDNSLNDSVSQGFPTQQSTQQVEKINPALINNYLINKEEINNIEVKCSVERNFEFNQQPQPQLQIDNSFFATEEEIINEFKKYYSHNDAIIATKIMCQKSKSKGQFNRRYLQDRVANWVRKERNIQQLTVSDLELYINQRPKEELIKLCEDNGVTIPEVIYQICTQSKAISKEFFIQQIIDCKKNINSTIGETENINNDTIIPATKC